jgi:hypothetical protein
MSYTLTLELSKESLARCIITAVVEKCLVYSVRLTVTGLTVFVGL